MFYPACVLDVPNTPGKPDVVDYDSDRIDIQWSKPTSDNGSPIQEYIIERKERGSPIWHACGKVNGKTTAFSATGLTQGSEFEFRLAFDND